MDEQLRRAGCGISSGWTTTHCGSNVAAATNGRHSSSSAAPRRASPRACFASCSCVVLRPARRWQASRTVLTCTESPGAPARRTAAAACRPAAGPCASAGPRRRRRVAKPSSTSDVERLAELLARSPRRTSRGSTPASSLPVLSCRIISRMSRWWSLTGSARLSGSSPASSLAMYCFPRVEVLVVHALEVPERRDAGADQVGPVPERVAVDEPGVPLGLHQRVARWRRRSRAASNCRNA